MKPVVRTFGHLWLIPAVLGSIMTAAYGQDDEGITWQVVYQGRALPSSPQWTWHGDPDVRPEMAGGSLRLADESEKGMGCYRANWQPNPDQETIVEAKVRVVHLEGYKQGGKGKGRSKLYHAWQTGSPIGILVSDGRRQEGLVLCEGTVATFLDRFHLMKTTDAAHVYRLVIRGSDMQVYVDGQRRIRGDEAFWKPATETAPFVQFGSNSKGFTGEAYWDYVKLGVRPAKTPRKQATLKITHGEPWTIPAGKHRQTRPYLYNVGQGVLLMSVAQGPDKINEPYGVLRSTDEGKTWTPVEGLQDKMFAPQPMLRLADGRILGVSRWNMRYEDYQQRAHHVGMSYLFDPSATSFQMYENKVLFPKEVSLGVFDRHIFDAGGGAILAVTYGQRSCNLMKTNDVGKTWTHFATIGKGDEPGVTRLFGEEWTALLRQDSASPLHQVWSHDGGKTWSQPTVLEEGSVDADIATLDNGLVAASYGRPGCCVMFSTDRGKTWGHHRVVTEKSGFNYTTLREIRPGRLLYIHDAPPLTALYIDVERTLDVKEQP